MIMENLIKQSYCVITFLGINHAINSVMIFFIFLFLVPHVDAQLGDAESPNESEGSLKLNPAVTIILIGLTAGLFTLGCFTFYGQSCFETNSDDGLVFIHNNRYPPRTYLRGLDPSVIDTFPTFLYSDVKGLKIGEAVLECAVCLNEFEDQETLRLLPKCCHVFHPECIDTWLVSHVTCPVCRANLVPVIGEENDFNILTESTQPTQPLEGQPRVHESSELTVDFCVSSPEVVDLSRSTNQNRPPRSTPKTPKVDGKFPRSHSTGHSLIQPGYDSERFTLRLPKDMQKKLNKPELRRAKSNVAFTTTRSPKRWYRSASVQTSREKSKQGSYEQFDRENRLDQWDLTMTPSSISRSYSVQVPKESGSTHNSMASGSLINSVKSPFERMFGGKEKDNVGERSFARLMGNSPV